MDPGANAAKHVPTFSTPSAWSVKLHAHTGIRPRRNSLVKAYVSKQFPFLIKLECLRRSNSVGTELKATGIAGAFARLTFVIL